MTRHSESGIRVIPTGASLGADVCDIDLREDMDDATFSLIEHAWHEHGVLRFRGQNLDDDALVNFSQRFGVLDMAPTGRGGSPFDPSRPEITIVSNMQSDGKAIGALGNSELVWHQDMTYAELPPKASLLYCFIAPAAGGDTRFYNLYKAYETLPAALKERVADLSCKHDATRTSAGTLRHGYEESYSNEERPGAVHPLVVSHAATGRPVLYLGRRPNAWIVGLSDADSDALLDELWAHVHSHDFVWSQQWQTGDLVIWDNRCTFHRRDKLDPALDRLMHRTQVSDRIRPCAA